ncbi:MAG: tetratricopeptide repeat protein [Actinobacteria bacterium]|nr:tetratricopeptide repeat protein [Actinomycetota bacterium]
MGDSSLAKLRRALTRFPPDRYPVKSASLHRQIAHELAIEGKLGEAEVSLRTALELYRHDLPTERGETLNALGAVLRDRGRPGEAARVFTEAIELLQREPNPARAGAAHFNLGLVQREQGDIGAAEAAFHRAVNSFDAEEHPAELGAALRELGGLLLVAGREEEALPYLQRSAELAAAGGDRAGLGASANLTGLAQLALGDGPAATEAFAESTSAHPLGLRPEAHAMAKANLALACESTGEAHRARQLAHQTLSIAEASPPVVEQARSILERLGPGYDLHLLLDTEAEEAWPGVLRDEVRHWARTGPPVIGELASAWLAGMVERDATSVERSEALFAAVLELPPEDFDAIATAITTSLGSLPPDQAARFRSRAGRAAARFHIPQMRRLETAFELESP